MSTTKPGLVVDFDGCLHSYVSGWLGADKIPDEPVEGAITFLRNAVQHFSVSIYSSRSSQPGGIEAMQAWLQRYMRGDDRKVFDQIRWPTSKPPATFLTVDDRCIPFNGKWPSMEEMLNFKPWWQQKSTPAKVGRGAPKSGVLADIDNGTPRYE